MPEQRSQGQTSRLTSGPLCKFCKTIFADLTKIARPNEKVESTLEKKVTFTDVHKI